ncbi:Serine/threonine-protein kinase ATM, partial [Ananas comosus]
MATSRDVREVIAKLSSDKAKSREVTIHPSPSSAHSRKTPAHSSDLGSFELISGRGEAAEHLARRREVDRVLQAPRPQHCEAETWPFMITLLTKCVALEISASKKRPPKIMLAKALRAAVQCAEDSKLSGKPLLLLSVGKLLFNHIWDVIKDVPSFHSEYASILRHLLTIKEYRYEMRNRIYCSLVILYMNKVVTGLDSKNNSQTNTKEEVFRYVLTLHVLLENPPGDFPANLREDVVKGFSEIFAHVRDEGKVSRKLMECINTYLLKDGPNLGCQAMEIHSAVQEFMFHCWLTTHDRGMKNLFIIYTRVLLKLNRGTSEGSRLVEQLLDIIIKELDQSISSGAAFLWAEIPRDEKAGSLGSIQEGFMELAAAVLYQVIQACKNTVKTLYKEKRLKMVHTAAVIKDGISKDSWVWILNNTNAVQFQDALVWLLRALQEFSSVLLAHNSKEPSRCLSLTFSE